MRVELIKTLGDEMLAAMRRIVQPINEKLAAFDALRQTLAVAIERHAGETRAQALQIEKLQSDVVLLRSALQDMPAGQKGERGDAGPRGEKGEPGEKGEAGPPGRDGADGRDGIDGKDGAPGLAGKDGRDGIDGKDGAPGLAGKDGRDGIDGKDGAPGERGEKGEKGDPGAEGKSVTIDDVQPVLDVAVSKALLELERKAEYVIQKAADRMPKPKDGKDGRDALDLDDLFIEHDGERTVTIGFRRGTEVVSKTIKFPTQIDRGVYKIDRGYEAGDGVTYGGDYWHAVRDAQPGDKPGESDAWRLAVRKGRDGRRG